MSPVTSPHSCLSSEPSLPRFLPRRTGGAAGRVAAHPGLSTCSRLPATSGRGPGIQHPFRERSPLFQFPAEGNCDASQCVVLFFHIQARSRWPHLVWRHCAQEQEGKADPLTYCHQLAGAEARRPEGPEDYPLFPIQTNKSRT